MNRRGFLKLLGLAGAGLALAPELVLDPERALWVPGQKVIFDLGAGALELLPLRSAFPLSPDWLTREALRVLQNQLSFIGSINRQYDEQFTNGQSVGEIVRLTGQAASTITLPPPDTRFLLKVKLPARRGDPLVLRPGEEFITIARG